MVSKYVNDRTTRNTYSIFLKISIYSTSQRHPYSLFIYAHKLIRAIYTMLVKRTDYASGGMMLADYTCCIRAFADGKDYRL
jgi:hypothetical protein